VACNAPLLQRWFAGTGHPAARDPYFLYAASNLGSLLALLGYPFVIEPALRLHDQSRLWLAGYGLLVVLVGACALCLWRTGGRSQGAGVKGQESRGRSQGSKVRKGSGDSSLTPDPCLLTPGRRLRWVLLAFVPSSLTLSVTTYL